MHVGVAERQNLSVFPVSNVFNASFFYGHNYSQPNAIFC